MGEEKQKGLTYVEEATLKGLTYLIEMFDGSRGAIPPVASHRFSDLLKGGIRGEPERLEELVESFTSHIFRGHDCSYKDARDLALSQLARIAVLADNNIIFGYDKKAAKSVAQKDTTGTQKLIKEYYDDTETYGTTMKAFAGFLEAHGLSVCDVKFGDDIPNPRLMGQSEIYVRKRCKLKAEAEAIGLALQEDTQFTDGRLPETKESTYKVDIGEGYIKMPKDPDRLRELVRLARARYARNDRGLHNTLSNMITRRASLGDKEVLWWTPIPLWEQTKDPQYITLNQFLEENKPQGTGK